MTDVDDEERQETEEDAAERQVRLKRFDWSFAKGEDIVYGDTSEGWLVLPRSNMEALADSPQDRDEDGIPFWRPDSEMAEWMPSGILDEYGVRRFDFAGSPIYAIVDIDGLLDGLRSVGPTCERDDELVDAAFNGR